MTTSLNISLPEELKQKATEQATKRLFSNASDYVRHLIRADVQKQEAQAELKAMLLEGLRSNASAKAPDTFFAELEQYIRTKTS